MTQQPVPIELLDRGRRWVYSEREIHRPLARVLTESERNAFREFFSERTLQSARLRVLPVINSPDAGPGGSDSVSSSFRIKDLLDFRDLEAITYVDTILLSRTRMPVPERILPLLFHELVHVAQYDILDADVFVEEYLRGWMQGGFEYEAIPLERQAFELEERFRRHPGRPFPVGREVRRLWRRS